MKAYTIFGSYQGSSKEAIDTADDEKTAEYLVGEYKLAYGSNWNIWHEGTMEFGSKEHLSALREMEKAWPKKVSQKSSKAICDGCCKKRRDVKSCGRDSNGDPDAPDLCFLCRKEGDRGKVWSHRENRYVYASYQMDLEDGMD